MQKDLSVSLSGLHNYLLGDLTWAGKVSGPLPCCFPSGSALFLAQQMVIVSRETVIWKKKPDTELYLLQA